MTTQQWDELQKAFNTQLGSNTYSKVAMMSPSEVEQILKDTNTKNQTDSTSVANDWIQKLTSNLPAPYQELAAANTQAFQQYQQAIAPQKQAAMQASQQHQNLVQRGPMFELAMRPELARISPTFMGANIRDLDAKLTAEGITDPFVKQSMIDSYMSYADRSMTMSLSALGQLYDSAVIAARTVSEDKQKEYERVADIYYEAYQATIMANRDLLESKLKISSSGLSEELESDFIDDLASISGLGSREKALTELNNKKTALIEKYGEENYNKLLKEVDRRFPETTATSKPLSRPTVSPSAFQGGQKIGGWFGEQTKEIKGRMAENIGEPLLTVGDFFKGLFAD